MPKLQLSNPRKRQHSEQRPLQLTRALQPLLKTQKKRQPPSYKSQTPPEFTPPDFPPEFWDNLSKLWLTRRALRELDRRNAQSASAPPPSCPSHRQTRGTLARHDFDKLKWSRQSTPSASDFLCDCAPRRLKDIKLFARHGGPNLTDLRGFSKSVNPLNHTMRPRVQKRVPQSAARTRITKSKINEKTQTTKSSGPYDRNFEQILVDDGVYPECYVGLDRQLKAKPNNWNEILERLAQPRRSLSPSKVSEEAHQKFKILDKAAYNEGNVTTAVIPIIEGEVDPPYCVSGKIPFRNLDQLGKQTLTPGNPDRFHGARPEQLDEQVRIDLSRQIIPTTETKLPIAPNHFLAVKGPKGDQAVVERQACYDGALGARGMHSLQSWGQEKPVYDNNAYVLTSTYLSRGHLTIYTSHVIQPKSGGKKPETCMHLIAGYNLCSNVENFRLGVIAYRNSIDWAREQRDKMIRRANARTNDSQAELRADDERVTTHALKPLSRQSSTCSSTHSRQSSSPRHLRKLSHKNLANLSPRDFSKVLEPQRRSQRTRPKPVI